MHNAYLTKRLRFLKDPLNVRTCDMSSESSIVFFGVPWDGAVAGRPGARYAPAHIATGCPDCITSVSSPSMETIASKSSQDIAAFPLPPYTTRFLGSLATSGSKT